MRRAELKNTERELYNFQLRMAIAAVVALLAFGLLLARFVYLQVLQHDYYQTKAEDNRISIVPVAPNRGLIVDRNGVVLAGNDITIGGPTHGAPIGALLQAGGNQGRHRPSNAAISQGHFAIGAEALDLIVSGQILHGHVSVILELGQLLVNVGVIDLSRPGLVPAWNVGNVDQAGQINILLQLFDQAVALGHDLVLDVEDALALPALLLL